MVVVIKQNDREISVIRNGNKVLCISNFPSSLAVIFYGDVSENHPLVLKESDSSALYNNLLWLMDQEYVFGEDSSKDENKLVWLSDFRTFGPNNTDRLVISRNEDSISINYSKPKYTDSNIKEVWGEKRGIKSVTSIFFEPAPYGQIAENINTHSSLQEDFGLVYSKTLASETIGSKKLVYAPKEDNFDE